MSGTVRNTVNRGNRTARRHFNLSKRRRKLSKWDEQSETEIFEENEASEKSFHSPPKFILPFFVGLEVKLHTCIHLTTAFFAK